MKLHLGCGKRFLPGFVHVDLDDHPHIDHRHRIDALPMFNTDSAALIYTSHCFEYFDRNEARTALEEWHRVLEPGGILRLAVPDFEALVEIYRNTGQLDLILGPLYGRVEIEGPDGAQVLYHRTVYDFAGLQTLLEECGFSNVHRYDWRQTVHRDHDDHSQAYIPHMDKENGRLISLNVEAEKY